LRQPLGEAKHERWNKETGITHTPTFFINGKKLPGRYDIKDIEKMIPQLEELLENCIKMTKQNK
jgi:glutaredoxin